MRRRVLRVALISRIRGAAFRADAQAVMAILEAGANERSEERMRRKRLGFEFGMKLAAEEPGVVRHFHDFDVHAVGSFSCDAESGARERLFVLAIEFVAVAMALGNFECAVGSVREGSRLEFAWPRAQAHGAAHFIHAEQFAQFINHAMRRLRIEFSAVRLLQSGDIARIFY